jgi:hypothetical protein
LRDKPRKLLSKRTRSVSLFSLAAGALDPFQTLAVDSSRLQTLLGNCKLLLLVAETDLDRLTINNGSDKARKAPEPVFSVAEELAFQNFRSVFRTGLVEPALLNAVMLSFVFAVTGGSINRECLKYQGQAISHIREKMSSLNEATSESTIGAILLLAGVEVCKPCSLEIRGVQVALS